MSVDSILSVSTTSEVTAVIGFIARGDNTKARKLLILLARKYFTL